jgi:hypothetical protein
MRSGRAVMSATMPAVAAVARVSDSTASNSGSLSSCMSLQKVIGRPFIIVATLTKAPRTRPGLARTSSAASGFFFCGMIDEPVVKAEV